MIRKILGLVLVLCMLFSMIVVPARAETSGTCGDNLIWSLDYRGNLSISGTGAMTNWSSSIYSPWYDLSIKKVIIGRCFGMDKIQNFDLVAFFQ